MSGAGLSMRAGHVRCLSAAGFHRMAYVEFLPASTPSAPPVICVHGLTRNGRDFDRLATALSASRRVASPDVVGRGQSEWLSDAAGYGYPQYCADMTVLLARLGTEQVDWVGTSMGGLIGMMLAAQPNSPIRRLVMNDIGPFVPAAALQRLGGYVGKDPNFDDLAGVETYLRQTHAPFGAIDDSGWQHLAQHGHRRLPDGKLGLAYDPAIGRVFAGTIRDVHLSSIWQRVSCPVLVLRGAESDLLPAATARDMAAKAEIVEVANTGHAPSLMVADQIEIVRSWLARP
jgi:pimeloyl-ACP methyl ester carboxylesterase